MSSLETTPPWHTTVDPELFPLPGLVCSPDSIIQRVNEAFVRVLEFERPEELIGQPLTSLMPQSIQKAHLAYFREASEKGLPDRPKEISAMRSVKVVGKHSEIPGLVNVKQFAGGYTLTFQPSETLARDGFASMGEVQLQELAALLNSSGGIGFGMVGFGGGDKTDSSSIAILSISRSLEVGVLGYALGELVGKTPYRDLLTERYRQLVDSVREQASDGSRVYDFVVEWNKKDGGTAWLQFIGWTYDEESTGPDGLSGLAFVKDVTEQVLQRNEIAERANLFREWLHEIQNAQMISAGTLEILMVQVEEKVAFLPVEKREFLLEVMAQLKTLSSAQKLTEKISDSARSLTDLTRSDAVLNHISYPIADLLEDLGEYFSGMLKEQGVELTLGIADDVPPLVEIDVERLGKVLRNLASNAIRKAESRVHIGVDRTDLLLEIKVIDNGPGIAPDLLENQTLFNAGVTDQEGIGHGHGLAIVQNTVRFMGGEVSVRNQSTGGALFTVKVPFEPVAKGVEAASGSSDPVAPPPLDGLHIAVADDTPLVRMIVKQFLTANVTNLSLSEFKDGKEVYETITSAYQGEERRPSLLIIDHLMGGEEKNGLPTIKKIRQLESEYREQAPLPIVMLTGSIFDETIRNELIELNAGYLQKPVKVEVLVSAIHTVLPKVP